MLHTVNIFDSSDLTNLRALEITMNYKIDLQPISKLVQLRHLAVHIKTNCGFIENLINLETLSLESLNVHVSLRKLTKLKMVQTRKILPIVIIDLRPNVIIFSQNGDIALSCMQYYNTFNGLHRSMLFYKVQLLWKTYIRSVEKSMCFLPNEILNLAKTKWNKHRYLYYIPTTDYIQNNEFFPKQSS